MNIAEKNGQPSMEEILASIRRIIADEPMGPNSAPLIDIRGHSRHHNLLAGTEDGGDFELPAIFRSQPIHDKPAPLFGRLTDALRSASGTAAAEIKQLRSNGEANSDPYFPASTEPSDAAWPAGASNGDVVHRGLSSLNVQRNGQHQNGYHFNGSHASEAAHLPAAPAPQVTAQQPPTVQNSAPAKPEPGTEVQRVMVPFRDMRMSGMCAGTPTDFAAALPIASAEPAAGHPTLDFAAIAPGNPEAPQASSASEAPNWPAVPNLDWESGAEAAAEMPAQPMLVQPVDSIENATADLLRPMLRQWLAENMPRMVEKALHIEVAQSVRVPRKSTEQ